MNIQSICSKCGGELIPSGENTYKCKFCGAVYREDTVKKEVEALSFLLDEDKREKVASLKQSLWKKVNEEYNDSEEILRICREIKGYSPDDFYANFYEAANSGQENEFIAILKNLDVSEHYAEMQDIVEYSLKSITPKNMDAICDLIERAFKQRDLSLYNEYRTKYDQEALKINDCIFDPAYPRNAFICYSSKDMDSVESLVRYLEEQGLLCFVAIRNLQHGRGAVQNYWKAIHTAIENCECIVFLSSTNSRSVNCDALQELRYVKELEQKRGIKIKKIEYLLENYIGAPVERTFKKIFEGLEYCYDEETVFDRIISAEPQAAPEAEPELDASKSVKYCSNCGSENLENAKFCFNCGKDEFVASKEEYIELLKRAKEELERQRAEQRNAPPAASGSDLQEELAAADASEDAAAEPAPESGNQEEIDEYFSGNMSFVDINVPNLEEDDHYFETSSRAQRRKARSEQEPAEVMELIKGQHAILPDRLRSATIKITNVYKIDDICADLYVFLLDRNEKVLAESDLVFFGNTMSLNRSVTMENGTDEDTVTISFNKINQDIEKIRFILSFDKEDYKTKNFSMLDYSDIRITLDDTVYYYRMSDVGRFESVSAFEFYRIRNKWKLNIQAAGLKEDIAELCNDYGIEVEQ